MILMNDFRREPQELLDSQLKACERVMRSGWYILGQEVTQFEDLWAQRCHMPHAIGVANGMDALEIALRTADLQPGDEVITTGMTAFATVLAIIRAGATPVLADIDPQTALLCPQSIERCITPKTKALVWVHLYGHICDMDIVQECAKRHGLLLIEDCAQAHLAQWQGKPAGSFGDINAFSFYPTKNLGALGDGGAITTACPTRNERARRLRNYGQSQRYYHTDLGLNSRLDELQAAILSCRLGWLEDFTEKRQSIAAQYQENIKASSAVQPLAPPQDRRSHVYHLFVLTTPFRDRLQQYLRDKGIETHIHYPVPVHQQSPTAHLRTDPAGLGATEQHAKTCLSIPCHPFLSDTEVHTVVDALNTFPTTL